jgi:hypothetical protein
MIRSMEDPIPLDLLQNQHALGVTHLSGHWHHLRHSEEGIVRHGGDTVTAPNAWQSRTQIADLPGNSAADEIDADAEITTLDDNRGKARNPLVIFDSDSEEEDQ